MIKISYQPLFDILENLKMTKEKFKKEVGINATTMDNFKHGRPVHLKILIKIMKYFHCGITAILRTEYIDDQRRESSEIS